MPLSFRSSSSPRAAKDLSSREDLLRYPFKAAKNRLIDGYRDRKRHEQAELVILRAIHASPEEILIEKEESAATQAELARLRTAIEKLEPPYVQLFRKLIYEEKQLVEIAEELGIKKGSIYTQYSRGLDHLARMLGIPQEGVRILLSRRCLLEGGVPYGVVPKED